MIYIHYLSTKYAKLKRHPTNSEIICRLRWLFCIFRTLSHRWQSKQQRFNDYYDYYCLLKYRDSTQYWNIENYFVTWHLIDARLFWLLLWQQLTLILIFSLCIVFLCLNNALSISLFVDYSPFLLDYNRIIFLFIVTLDDSIDLTRNSPAFGCTKHTHTNYYYHHRRRCRRYRHRRRRGNRSIVVVVIRRRFCC